MTGPVRRRVRRRAHGRCEYCKIPVRYDAFRPAVDHVVAKQHAGGSGLDNLAFSCAHCNGHKGPNLAGIDPVTRALTRLYHPRTDRWDDHFAWLGGVLVGRSPEGRATIMVLAINAPDRVGVRLALMAEGRY